MPRIYEYFGIVFFIWTDDHAPIHVHCQQEGRESVFELFINNGQLIKIVKRKGGKQLLPEQERKAIELIEVKYQDIAEKWFKIIFKGETRVKCVKINRRVK